MAAHAAVQRADALQMGAEDPLVALAELRAHRLEIGVELLHVGHAGDGGIDLGVLQHPLESRHHGSVALQRLLGLIARLGPAEASRHDFHGHHSDAGRFGPVDGGVELRSHREVVADEHDIDLPALDGAIDHRGLPFVGAHAGEADLPILLGDGLRFEQVVGDLVATVLAVQIPNVDVVGAQGCEGCVDVLQRPRLVLGVALARDVDLLAAGLERGAHHALVVAALVAARGIEIVDAEVGGLLDHAPVGGDHAAERDSGRGKPGAA